MRRLFFSFFIFVTTYTLLLSGSPALNPVSAQNVCSCTCPDGFSCTQDTNQCDSTFFPVCKYHAPMVQNGQIVSPAYCTCLCKGARYCIDTNNDGRGDVLTLEPGDPVFIYSALGCLPAGARPLITTLLRILMGVGGGIALLMTIYSAFIIITAGGDPKKVQAGKELLTASLAGLAFIALSIVVLNFIGVNVLGLSNLGFNL
jgi:hypothetical protein